jgi:SAM-dependent methyltransferase
MADQSIRFNDGAGYERMMGVWSRLAGEVFLDWLAPPPDLRWIDVGCGNGAFTELLVDRCAPALVHGVDPSEAQLAFARTRPASRLAQFALGDAMVLDFPNDSFDAATMALVIFFVPEPDRGIAEMVRVVRPGGLVAAYAWDMFGGGFPLQPIQDGMLALGHVPLRPPNPQASRLESLRELWAEAGLVAIETREISVQRSFVDFEEYWSVGTLAPGIAPVIAAMPGNVVAELKARVRERLPAEPDGRIIHTARANAVKGRLPV